MFATQPTKIIIEVHCTPTMVIQDIYIHNI